MDGGFKNDFYQRRDIGSDLATHTTLASDSSPFHEKYYMDDDGEILGEVSKVLPNYFNYFSGRWSLSYSPFSNVTHFEILNNQRRCRIDLT